MPNDRPEPRITPMAVQFHPAYVARALRWAGIDANVTEGDEPGEFVIDATDGRGEVGAGRLLSAVMLAFVDAGQPTQTIVEGNRR